MSRRQLTRTLLALALSGGLTGFADAALAREHGGSQGGGRPHEQQRGGRSRAAEGGGWHQQQQQQQQNGGSWGGDNRGHQRQQESQGQASPQQQRHSDQGRERSQDRQGGWQQQQQQPQRQRESRRQPVFQQPERQRQPEWRVGDSPREERQVTVPARGQRTWDPQPQRHAPRQPQVQPDHQQWGGQNDGRRQDRQPQWQGDQRRSDGRDAHDGGRERLFEAQRQRSSSYGVQLERQQRWLEQRSGYLQRDGRHSQYRFHQQYIDGLRRQARYARSYDYRRDPFFYTAASYRYSYGGHYCNTNQYGAQVLRDALNLGYQEGFRAAQADREDGWGYSYRDSYAYQDANYGYQGRYFDQSQYNYYFRQGFQRGYDDGYYSRYRYGYYRNGALELVVDILDTILDLRPLR